MNWRTVVQGQRGLGGLTAKVEGYRSSTGEVANYRLRTLGMTSTRRALERTAIQVFLSHYGGGELFTSLAKAPDDLLPYVDDQAVAALVSVARRLQADSKAGGGKSVTYLARNPWVGLSLKGHAIHIRGYLVEKVQVSRPDKPRTDNPSEARKARMFFERQLASGRPLRTLKLDTDNFERMTVETWWTDEPLVLTPAGLHGLRHSMLDETNPERDRRLVGLGGE